MIKTDDVMFTTTTDNARAAIARAIGAFAKYQEAAKAAKLAAAKAYVATKIADEAFAAYTNATALATTANTIAKAVIDSALNKD